MSATPVIASSLTRAQRPDRPLFVIGLLLVLIIVFAGFAPTFYLKGLFGTPPLSNLLFAHGLIMSIWIALLVVQTALVELDVPICIVGSVSRASALQSCWLSSARRPRSKLRSADFRRHHR